MLTREKARRGPAVPLSGDQWVGIEVTAEGGPLPGRLAQSAVVLQSRTLAPCLQLRAVLVLSFCFALL